MTANFRTALTDLFGLQHPILLAPMGAIAGGELAAAVTRAGGLGLIGPGYLGDDWINREFDAAGNARVGVGFITWDLAKSPQRLATCLARKPAAVMLSFGDAAPYVTDIKASGAKLILQVQSVAAAKEAARLGADVIVAQGIEGGGHGARPENGRSLLPLLPAVVDAVSPVPSPPPAVSPTAAGLPRRWFWARPACSSARASMPPGNRSATRKPRRASLRPRATRPCARACSTSRARSTGRASIPAVPSRTI